MRLAFVTSLLPERQPRSGFAVANRAVVDGLSALGHEVVSIGARQDETVEPYGEHVLLGTLKIENATASRVQKARWAGRSLLQGIPVAAAKLRPIGATAVERALARARPDALILNSYQIAAAFPSLRRRPFVYVAHNVEAATARQNAKGAGSTIERPIYARDARLLERLESELGAEARHVWCLSDADRAAFPVEDSRSSVLPLLFPDVEPIDPNGPKPFDAVMIGTWTWEANATGLRWFVDRVVPLLPKDMRIAVAGSLPVGFDLTDARLVSMGRVESARGSLEQGHVVPLAAQGGTGVQLKTIEAFQQGLATVATPSSVRGISALPANCVVAAEERGFAEALIEAAGRGRNGEALSSDPTGWVEQQKRRLEDALRAGVASFA